MSFFARENVAPQGPAPPAGRRPLRATKRRTGEKPDGNATKPSADVANVAAEEGAKEKIPRACLEAIIAAFPLPVGKTFPELNSEERHCLAVHLFLRYNTVRRPRTSHAPSVHLLTTIKPPPQGARLVSTFDLQPGNTLHLPCSDAWPLLNTCSVIKVVRKDRKDGKKLKFVNRSTGLNFGDEERNKLISELRVEVIKMDIEKLRVGLEEEKKAREEGDLKLQKQIDKNVVGIDMLKAIIEMMASRFDEQDVVVKRLNALYNEHGLVGVSNAEHISNLQKELDALKPELESKFGAEFVALRSITDDLATAVDEGASASDVRKLQKRVGALATGLEQAKAAQQEASAESAEGLADLRNDVDRNNNMMRAQIGGVQMSTFQLQSGLDALIATVAAMHHQFAALAEKVGMIWEQLKSFIIFLGYPAFINQH